MTDLAAAVISTARHDYGRGAAGFDHAIAGGNALAERTLLDAIDQVANRGLGGDPQACDQRAEQLREQLADELDAYRARCRSRRYTGWSLASTGPVRYAR